MKTPTNMTAHRAEMQKAYKKAKKKRRRIRKAEKKRELKQKKQENQQLAEVGKEEKKKPSKWRRITVEDGCKKAVNRPVDEDEINELLERRTRAKTAKDYDTADKILEQLVELEICYDDARKEWHTRALGEVAKKKAKGKGKAKDKEPTKAATVDHIESMEDFNAMLKTSKSEPCILDFTATWCPPCKMIAPIFEGFAREFPSIRFYKVDVDDAEEVAETCQVRSMPTFQLFRNGAKVDELDGADQEALKRLLEKHR